MTAADEPLDAVDLVLLGELAAAFATADPPPADLDARVGFALALAADDFIVAALAEDALIGSGARSSAEPRTLTFDCELLTIMVTVRPLPDGRRRLDGWLAPAAALGVAIRSGDETVTVRADETGRFVAEAVAAGLTQLSVRLPEAGKSVVTPAVVL